jgi:hypothetical protein
MVASWGGYSFVINIIPIHTLVHSLDHIGLFGFRTMLAFV